MKNLAFLGGVAGLCLAGILASHLGHAAEGSAAFAADPMADINDLYTWMDGTRLNLALTVSRGDVDSRTFGPGVQYVFHVHSKTGIGVGVAGTGTEVQVICTFESNTSARCWVVDPSTNMVKDFIAGDPSNPAGISSTSGQIRMFAGRRSDPAFFNLQGFRQVIKAMKSRHMTTPITLNAAGCPTNLSGAELGAIAPNLSAEIAVGEPPCPNASRDCFANGNVKLILVQVDKSLVTSSPNTAVGVWASTHLPESM